MHTRTVRFVFAFLAVISWASGCTRHAAGPPATPAPPSKGSGLKERMPIVVTAGDRLGWVDNALRTYPSDRFHTGLGIGPDLETAQHRSLTELEKPFYQAITGRHKSRINAMDLATDASGQTVFTTMDQHCRRALGTVRSLSRVAEVFLERKPAVTYYAPAVLDRPAFAERLIPMVQEQDRRLQAMMLRLDQGGVRLSPADKNALMEAFVRRESLDAAISVVRPPVNPHPRQAATIARLLKKK